MERVVVSDTNIFIDLIKLDLLGAFFDLPYEIHTTDFVIGEITDQSQHLAVNAFIKRGRLIVGDFSAEELDDIVECSAETGGKISLTDASVWVYARKNGCSLLTGDKHLRIVATKDNIDVRGILHVFKELVSHKILTPPMAAELLIELKGINTRLPVDEVDSRIREWEER